MLLIFDLDDTLIDTFHSVTILAYKALILELNKKRSVQLNVDQALVELIELRFYAGSSMKTLELFFNLHKIESSLKTAFDFVYCFRNYFEIELSPGVYEFLKKNKHIKKVIVTRGVEDRQRDKIRKSKLSMFHFEKVVVVSSGDKSQAYQEVLNEFKPKKSILIADRKEDFAYTQGLFTKRVFFVVPYFKEVKLDFFEDLKISNLKDLADVL